MFLLIFLLPLASAASLDFELTILNHTSLVKDSCTHLHIQFVNMTEHQIEAGTFRLCRKTVILDLSHNRLKYLQSGAFLEMASLEQLHLGNNLIERVEPGTFYTLFKLQYVTFADNRLRELPQLEFQSSKIRSFSVSHNRLREIPASTFYNVYSTDLIDLSMNQLKYLHPYAFINLAPGATIILSGNDLRRLELDFATTVKVGYTDFQVCCNYLNELRDNVFGKLHKLRLSRLDVSFNNISYVQDGIFKDFHTLKHLDLTHNRVYHLSKDIFKDLTSLVSLDLSFNKLKSYVFNLKLADTIKYINYSNNQIDRLSEFGWISQTGKRGVYLNVDNNQITNIDSNLFCSFIATVSFNYNDWICEVLYVIVQNLNRRNINVLGGFEYNTDNIHGIPCTLKAEHILRDGIQNTSYVTEIEV